LAHASFTTAWLTPFFALCSFTPAWLTHPLPLLGLRIIVLPGVCANHTSKFTISTYICSAIFTHVNATGMCRYYQEKLGVPAEAQDEVVSDIVKVCVRVCVSVYVFESVCVCVCLFVNAQAGAQALLSLT